MLPAFHPNLTRHARLLHELPGRFEWHYHIWHYRAHVYLAKFLDEYKNQLRPRFLDPPCTDEAKYFYQVFFC